MAICPKIFPLRTVTGSDDVMWHINSITIFAQWPAASWICHHGLKSYS